MLTGNGPTYLYPHTAFCQAHARTQGEPLQNEKSRQSGQ